MGPLKWLKKKRAAVHYDSGTLLVQRGDFGKAVKYLQKATELEPLWAEAHHNLGNALIGVHQNEAAVAALDHAISLRSDFPEAHNNRGRALVSLGRYDEAMLAFETALELAPDYTKARENWRLCKAWIEGSGPPIILPDDVPWLAQLVLSRRLTWDQAARLIGVFIRLEERLYQVQKDQVKELRTQGKLDLAQRLEEAFGLSARPDHIAKLMSLDQSRQDELVGLVLTGGDQVL